MFDKLFKSWVMKMVITFILGQLEKYRDTLDWSKIRADVERLVRQFPGDLLDDAMVALAMAFVSAAENVLNATDDIEDIFEYVAQGKFQEAWETLRDLILNQWSPSTEEEKFVYACVEGCDTVA